MSFAKILCLGQMMSIHEEQIVDYYCRDSAKYLAGNWLSQKTRVSYYFVKYKK